MRKFTRLPDGTCWARSGTQKGRQLRYSLTPDYDAASIVDCYETLIWLPAKRRNEVIKQLRADALDVDEFGDPAEPVKP